MKDRMKRILLSLLFLNAVQSADVVTVDPTGVTTIAGTASATAPGAGEVKIGGGQIRTAGNINVNATVYAKDIIVGTGTNAENHKLIFLGPNSPAGEGSQQALSFEFMSAGSAQIRAFRGGSWDTYLQFLTNSSLNDSSTTPAVRMHISENGNVGIGTTSPANKLTVAGDFSASSVIINGKAPGQPGGIAMLDDKGKLVAAQLPLEALNQLPIPSFSVDGAGTTIAIGGRFFFNSLNISATQSVSIPTKIFSSGDVVIGAAVTSSSPIEIEAQGNVVINAGITAPFLSIRTAGSVTINGPINMHGASGVNQWTFSRLKLTSHPGPYWDDTNQVWVPIAEGSSQDLFRALIVESEGNISSTSLGPIKGVDIFIHSNGTISLGANVQSVLDYGSFSDWSDGYRNYSSSGYGGVGGTAGGWGRYGSAAGSNIWRGTNSPYLIPTYDLARGSATNIYRTDGRGAPGGRISVYARNNIVADNMKIYADSMNNNSSGYMVGGAGTVRAVAGGNISGGSWSANGGTGNGSQEHGGGGGAFTVASSYSGTVVVSATAVAQAVAGTSMQVTLPTATIHGLDSRGIFSVFPPKTQTP